MSGHASVRRERLINPRSPKIARSRANRAVLILAFLLFFLRGIGSQPLLADDSTSRQLTLSDLADYRTALSGKATAPDARGTDPPVPATFRDLWDKPGALKGRRVEIRGKIERIFRQGAVGHFPALVQAWAFARNGDPFCLVYPDSGDDQASAKNGTASPLLGRDIQFTGTFLKIVEYPAGDGSRLAPMIVGDLLPEPVKTTTKEPAGTTTEQSYRSWNSTDLIVGMIAMLVVAGAFGMRHLRGGHRRVGFTRKGIDPPLEFIDSRKTEEGHHAG